MDFQEATIYADSVYAIGYHSKAIELFDLYTNNHSILKKPDKTIGDKRFRTTKLPLNFYKLVVKFICNFVFAQPVSVKHKDPEFNAFLTEFHKQNFIHRHNIALLENMSVFGTAFEHIFLNEEGKIRIRMIDGMAAVPFWDDYMELERFIEDYKVKDELLGETRYLRIYEPEITAEFVISNNKDMKQDVTENVIGKIPIIAYKNNEFHRTMESDLEIIKPIVEELERIISNQGDVIHYHADPILVAFGQKLPDIGGTGKILNFEKGADVRYLTWDQNVQAVDWYYNQLKNLIFELSMTPKFVFDQQAVSSLSGVALKLMYSAALIKAQEKIAALKYGFTKRYEYLADIYYLMTGKTVDVTDLEIDFAVSVPTNESEIINNILTLYNSGLMSKETAMQKAPYIEDVQGELERLAKEQTEQDIYANQLETELNMEEQNESGSEAD